MQQLHDKVAFITGGAGGIGLGMARAFLQAGMKVMLADLSEAHLNEAAAQLPQSAVAAYRLIQLDVTDRAAMARAADETERVFGKVHVLCNNAGIGGGAPMSSATYADWDHVLSVNLNGVINGVVTFMPRLCVHAEGGHIVNTASIAGILALADDGGIYSTTKFAVRGLSESLRLTLAPRGIGVSVLCPGLTRSHILEDARKASEAAGDERSASFAAAQEFAMDPVIVGEAVLAGIQRNDAYILPHSEFVDEVREMHAALVASFRTDLPIDPRRAAFEAMRRKAIADLQALSAR